MNASKTLSERLIFLTRVVKQEIKHLNFSNKQVFSEPFSQERGALLANDEEFAEKVEAFVSRFGRLQDTVGDKLLPFWLSALGEKTGAFIDNLNKAEKLGMLSSAEKWLQIRQLRNQMVHDYIEDVIVLADALQSAHEQIGFVQQFAENLLDDIANRKLL